MSEWWFPQEAMKDNSVSEKHSREQDYRSFLHSIFGCEYIPNEAVMITWRKIHERR